MKIPILLLAASFLPAQTPGIATKILMQEPLGDTPQPNMSLSILNLNPGLTVPSHSHAGAVFAYVLQGDIENQIDPDPPNVYHPGGFFHERPLQVHRLLRSLSQTEPAKILLLQNTGALSANAKPLIHEPLPNIPNQQVSMIGLVVAPGAAVSAHQHPGPVFAYVVKGEIETQVDPDPPEVYRGGEAFYEPPLHARRLFRNLRKAEPAELIIFEVSEKGQPLATSPAQ